MGVNSIMNDAGRIGFVVKGTYDNTATYDFLDVVYYNNATYVAKKLTVGNEPQSSSEFWQVLVNGEVGFNDVAPTFLQAETRENINSGEKLPVLFGKIKKWYTDLKAVAFSGSYNDLSDTPSIPAAVAVKGNAESSYRTGNVNLTPANIGAVPTANVLDSKESITANTASGNVAGALGTKEINANLQSQIDTLNSNLIPNINALFTAQPSDYFEIQYLTTVKIGNFTIASLTIHILSDMTAWTQYRIATANSTSIKVAGTGFLISQNTNNAYVLTGGRGYDIDIRTDNNPPQKEDWLRGIILFYQS